MFSFNLNVEGWTQPLTVNEVSTYGNSDHIILTVSDASNNSGQYTDGCHRNLWAIDTNSEDRRDRIYSTLMAALVSGKKIALWFQDNCGVWDYHKASVVKLRK